MTKAYIQSLGQSAAGTLSGFEGIALRVAQVIKQLELLRIWPSAFRPHSLAWPALLQVNGRAKSCSALETVVGYVPQVRKCFWTSCIQKS